MKFFLLFLLFSFSLLSSSFSKILNIENKIQIEVPDSHKFIKYDNEDVKNSIEEFVQDYEGMEIDLYLVGPKKYVDLEKAIIDGEDPMDNEYVRSIMKKLERKNLEYIKISKKIYNDDTELTWKILKFKNNFNINYNLRSICINKKNFSKIINQVKGNLSADPIYNNKKDIKEILQYSI